MDDHHQEVIAYCRENNFNGLIADDAEYAAFDPPRYFSSEQLKLTYKVSTIYKCTCMCVGVFINSFIYVSLHVYYYMF